MYISLRMPLPLPQSYATLYNPSSALQDRRREALNARYRATREEAMDRLRMGPTVPYDVLIREVEERFGGLVDEQTS